jgi:hypothetical protein
MKACRIIAEQGVPSEHHSIQPVQAARISARNEYFIPVAYDGYASTLMEFCPWCGAKLPESKRELWYEVLAFSSIKSAHALNPKNEKTSVMLAEALVQSGDKTGASKLLEAYCPAIPIMDQRFAFLKRCARILIGEYQRHDSANITCYVRRCVKAGND